MTRVVAAGMIVLYQRHVSPHKGFGCPMRVLRGRNSCAEFARRAVRRVGVIRLLPLLLRRMDRCAAARRSAARGGGVGNAPQSPGPDEPRSLDYAGPRTPTSPAESPRERRWKWRRDGNGYYCGEPRFSDLVCTGASCCCPPWQ